MTPNATGVAFAPAPADAPVLNELPPPPVAREHVTLGPAMDAMFRQMCDMGASDLHISSMSAPLIRKDGEMCRLYDHEGTLSAEGAMRLLMEITPEKNRKEFEERHDSDFAYEIAGLARFRANIFMDRHGVGAVFRVIPSKIMSAEALGLSPQVLNLCSLKKGLVLVTGPTGSGKSTTLCAMIDYVNRMRADHIITIEDPIEFVHNNQKCLINQREVHTHTRSFKDALRAALREDPDVILVGELRDLETIAIAIETAETGHLVFGTLHTTTAASTVDRVIDQFPADRQAQIRVMLSESLRGVIAQTLCKKVGGGRVAALEILIANGAISNLIREGKTFQINSMIQVGRASGMMTLNDALGDLVKKTLITPEEAVLRAVDKTGMEALLKRAPVK
ncbi:MAG: type IV pilus twitching motility protein PilT [Vicinamibacterales bacterium]